MKTTPVDFLAGLAIFALATLAAPAVPVTFQVNLAYQINNTSATFDPLNDTVVKGSVL
jgi:hypothetical protein